MAQSPPVSTIRAEIGDVSGGSQVAVGNNILQIGQLHGDLVYALSAKPAPPRLRTQPVSLRPRAFPGLLDRATETSITLIEVGARRSVECSGEAGTGKTSFLRHVAYQAALETFGAGVLYFQVNRQSTSDLLKSLFDAFYETEIPIKPTETEIRAYLRDLNALILLDDVDGDEKKIESLMNVATGCTFLSATPKRTLFGETQALTLRGLPNPDAVTLFERELGRSLSPTEKQVAERLCESLGCVPQRILLAAHQARERKGFLEAIALLPVTTSADSLAAAEVETSSDDERKVLAALRVFAGAPVGAGHIVAIADVPGAPRVLATLEERGLVSSHNGRYVLSSVIGNALDEELDPLRKKALAHFYRWSVNGSRNPQQIASAAEPALLLVKWGVGAGMYQEAQGLAHAMQSPLALSGKWDIWAEALQALLSSARATRDKGEEAWTLHQLGTRALCLGVPSEARELLQHALSIRESIGDASGAKVTRHNLNLIPAAAPTNDDATRRNSKPGRSTPLVPPPPPPPHRFRLMIGGVVTVAAIIAAFVLFWPKGDEPEGSKRVSFDFVPNVTDSVPSANTDTVGATSNVDTVGATNNVDTVGATHNVDSLTPPRRPLPQIVRFKVDPPAITSGQQAQLCFSVKDAIAVQIPGQLPRRNVATDSECITVNPEASRLYTLTAFNADGAVATRTTDIKVVVPDLDVPDTDTVAAALKRAQIVEFGVSSPVVTAGSSISVCYEIANATRASISPLRKSLVGNTGCVPHTPSRSTTYTLTVIGADQVRQDKTADVTVIKPPGHARILSFDASSTNVVAGTAVQLCWEVVDAQQLFLRPSDGPLGSVNGCINRAPTVSTRYVLTAIGEDNQREDSAVVIAVRRPESTVTRPEAPPAPDAVRPVRIAILEIRPDQPARLCYRVENARSASIEPSVGAVRLPAACNRIVSPKPATYTLRAIGADGRQVEQSVSYKPDSVDSFSVQIVSFKPDSQTIKPGTSARLCFQLSGVGAATLLPEVGSITAPIRTCVDVSPKTTTVYILTARSVSGGQLSDTSIVKVTTPSVKVPPPSVILRRR